MIVSIVVYFTLLVFVLGVLHDRRARSFHVPLRARQASVENLQGSCASRYLLDIFIPGRNSIRNDHKT